MKTIDLVKYLYGLTAIVVGLILQWLFIFLVQLLYPAISLFLAILGQGLDLPEIANGGVDVYILVGSFVKVSSSIFVMMFVLVLPIILILKRHKKDSESKKFVTLLINYLIVALVVALLFRM